jgi:hypothetical protein
MGAIRDGKLLYHLTALKNLSGIMEHGLLSRDALRELGLSFEDVADPEILRDRGDLDRFVPFHFFARNPFDYAAIHRNPGTTMMILAVHRRQAERAGWSIIPAHPLSGDGQIQVLPWAHGIGTIDWDLMEQREYRDNACKQACMAEALSPEPVLLSACQSIFVSDEHSAVIVRKVVGDGRAPYVNVNPRMFP